jgi:hypothetical protein
LFLACFAAYPKFAGKGHGARDVLEIRLSAVSEKVISDGEVSGNFPDKYLAVSPVEETPAVLPKMPPPASENGLSSSSGESEPVPLLSNPENTREDAVRFSANESEESFFPNSRLSVPPVMVTDSAIDDLLSMFGERLEQGMYILRLYIDRDGRVVDVLGTSSLKRESSDRILDQLIAAFKTIRFFPAQINEHAVNSQIEFEINAVDEFPGSSKTNNPPVLLNN